MLNTYTHIGVYLYVVVSHYPCLLGEQTVMCLLSFLGLVVGVAVLIEVYANVVLELVCLLYGRWGVVGVRIVELVLL